MIFSGQACQHPVRHRAGQHGGVARQLNKRRLTVGPGGHVVNQRLLERDAVFRAVRPALLSAREGRTASVFLVGEAGLGKTSALAAAVRQAPGFQVVRSRGEAAEVSLPFGFLAQIPDCVQAEDARAPVTDLPVAERAAAAWYRLRRWASADRPAPLLLALDDLHWADPDSLTLLRLLIQQVRAVPMAVIATLRPWPSAAAELVAEVTAERLGTAVRLRALTLDASAELLGRLTGATPAADLLGSLEELCAGNPLLIHQLARDLQSRVGLTAPNDVVDPGRLLLSRFTGLDPAGLDFARAAAVCGVEFHPQVAAALAGLAGMQARDALTGLCQAGLVRSGDRGLAGFTHALLQQALYEDLPEPVRIQLHAATFELLWQQGAPAAEAARHAVAGHLRGDTNAVTCLEQAGLDASSRGALDAATQQLTAAVELAGQRAEPRLQLRLADALHASGAPARALDVCKALLRGREDHPPPWVAEAYRLLGRLLYEMGEIAQAGESFEHAARQATGTNRELAVEALLEASLYEFTLTGPRRALRFATHASHFLGQQSDPELVAWVTAARGNARMMMADPDGAADVERAVATVPRGTGLRGLHGSVVFGPRFAQLLTAKFQERFTEASEVFELAMAEARHAEVPFAFSLYGVAHAETLVRLGRLTEAQQLLEQAMEDAPWLPVRWPYAAIGLAEVSFELDKPSRAASYCERIEAGLPYRENTQPMLWMWVWRNRANLALHAGNSKAACSLMQRVEQATEQCGLYEPCALRWADTAIIAYLRAGRLADTQRIIDQLLTLSSRLPCQWPRAIAARGQALLADQTGDCDTAHRCFKHALTAHESIPMPLAETETRLAYGGFLRRTGATTAARNMLHQAVYIAASIGAARLERLATEELHAAGGRRRHSQPDAETLTPVQHRIATLVASGLTNSEIGRQLLISHRTVEHHLTNIYAALSLSSRRQLRDLIKARTLGTNSTTPTTSQDHGSV